MPRKANESLSHASACFRVRNLEAVEPAFALFPGEMYVGLLPFDHSYRRTGNLMIWLFAPEQPTVTDSLVVWFNGGPGPSRMLFLVRGAPL